MCDEEKKNVNKFCRRFCFCCSTSTFCFASYSGTPRHLYSFDNYELPYFMRKRVEHVSVAELDDTLFGATTYSDPEGGAVVSFADGQNSFHLGIEVFFSSRLSFIYIYIFLFTFSYYISKSNRYIRYIYYIVSSSLFLYYLVPVLILLVHH